MTLGVQRNRALKILLLQNGAAVDEKYYSKPFQFLSLGAMAYIGMFKATFTCKAIASCEVECLA